MTAGDCPIRPGLGRTERPKLRRLRQLERASDHAKVVIPIVMLPSSQEHP